MHEPVCMTGKVADPMEILAQLEALVQPSGPTMLYRISSLANAAALLGRYLERVNWVGFYLVDEQLRQLVLGPFWGAPACTVIPFGKGVCGTAWSGRETMTVPDVHAFAGHIACDAASRSEVVVPLVSDGMVVGVLDVDSPILDRFAPYDVHFLEKAAEIVSRVLPFT